MKAQKKKELKVDLDIVEYLSYFISPVISLSIIFFHETLGTVLPVIWIQYALLPLLDYFSPLDLKNRTAEEYEALEKDWRYLIPLYLAGFVVYAVMIWSFYVIYYESADMTWGQLILFTITTPGVLVLGANVGHELTHRREMQHRVFAIFMMLPMLNTNYSIQHTRGHHLYVGTNRDPSTA